MKKSNSNNNSTCTDVINWLEMFRTNSRQIRPRKREQVKNRSISSFVSIKFIKIGFSHTQTFTTYTYLATFFLYQAYYKWFNDYSVYFRFLSVSLYVEKKSYQIELIFLFWVITFRFQVNCVRGKKLFIFHTKAYKIQCDIIFINFVE